MRTRPRACLYAIHGLIHFTFSIFCVLFTVYSISTVYGVFLEKKFFLLPFICIQGLITVIMFLATLALAVVGVATNAIQKHHEDSRPLRDLYYQYSLDPDDEISE
ncbi:monovalent cation/H+ antiporter subunit B domain protein [Ostertagia ostertagi]